MDDYSHTGDWWVTPEGIESEARRLGVVRGVSEPYQQYLQRLAEVRNLRLTCQAPDDANIDHSLIRRSAIVLARRKPDPDGSGDPDQAPAK